jgi:hypothetical protein
MLIIQPKQSILKNYPWSTFAEYCFLKKRNKNIDYGWFLSTYFGEDTAKGRRHGGCVSFDGKFFTDGPGRRRIGVAIGANRKVFERSSYWRTDSSSSGILLN